eukprot:TRINITY_DN27206_c0_g1_i1.p2 TRINITY_DN27206_c0_g1~~TRINITY_DN27206_c0_g1_i1.p2  ORF type:complete len:107 (-),score=14.75 TRINITY_DN27206_c0_g1_i1:196-516(-)
MGRSKNRDCQCALLWSRDSLVDDRMLPAYPATWATVENASSGSLAMSSLSTPSILVLLFVLQRSNEDRESHVVTVWMEHDRCLNFRTDAEASLTPWLELDVTSMLR